MAARFNSNHSMLLCCVNGFPHRRCSSTLLTLPKGWRNFKAFVWKENVAGADDTGCVRENPVPCECKLPVEDLVLWDLELVPHFVGFAIHMLLSRCGRLKIFPAAIAITPTPINMAKIFFLPPSSFPFVDMSLSSLSLAICYYCNCVKRALVNIPRRNFLVFIFTRNNPHSV